MHKDTRTQTHTHRRHACSCMPHVTRESPYNAVPPHLPQRCRAAHKQTHKHRHTGTHTPTQIRSHYRYAAEHAHFRTALNSVVHNTDTHIDTPHMQHARRHRYTLTTDMQRDTCISLQYCPPAPLLMVSGSNANPFPPTRSILTAQKSQKSIYIQIYIYMYVLYIYVYIHTRTHTHATV